MIVKVNNLVKRYGAMIALDHFNLEIQEGEIFGLLGPNVPRYEQKTLPIT